MIAVDVLEVQVSYQNNRYLLVIQDYFTKWAEAVPLPDQTTNRITEELVKSLPVMIFRIFSIQTRARILRVLYCCKPWMPLVLAKPGQLPTTFKVMEWLNVSIVPCSRCSVLMSENRQIGNAFSPLSYLRIGQQSMHPQDFPHFNSCLDDHHRRHHFRKQLPMNQCLTMPSYVPN